eukprot:TRINITY_DN3957_c0_g1_i1.p1 TRINITY_DN3957_c0_g1~~TRINITY_DN3957_c0_g1_i1.p1  ORF type:complete len:700 (-),score=244.22 TRINITY_DN3957_c0_g1_i1:57-2156(-)
MEEDFFETDVIGVIHLEIEGIDFGDEKGGIEVVVRPVGSTVSYGQSKELEGSLQDDANDIYVEWSDATFAECCDELVNRTEEWLYWRIGLDPTGKHAKKEQDRLEAAKKEQAEKQKSATPATKLVIITKDQDQALKRAQKAQALALKQAEKLSAAKRTLLLAKLARERQHTVAHDKEYNKALDALASFEKSELTFGSQDVRALIASAKASQSTFVSLTNMRALSVPKGITILEWLQELNMMSNRISVLPKFLGKLRNLQKLILTDNQITTIEVDFAELKQLRVLKLGENQLKKLPPTLTACSSLQVLEVEKNRHLGEIPFELSNCRKLNYLGLEHTNVKVLPPELGTLTQLESLKLKNTPMKMIPSDVFQKGTEEVLKFLRGYIPGENFIGESTFQTDLGKLFGKSDFTDFILKLKDGTKIPTHRFMLKARCPSFLKTFPPEPEDGKFVATISEISPEIIHVFLRYVYLDDVDVDFAQTDLKFQEELMSFAEFHRISRLHNVCTQFHNFQSVIQDLIPVSTFSTDFQVLLTDVELVDATFETEGEIFRVHKGMICTRSAYFKSMFDSGLKEAQQEIVPLEISPAVLRMTLEYLYTDDISEMDGEFIIETYTTSHSYELDRMRCIVENVIGYSLDVDNVACILDLAVTYSCTVLKRACVFFMIKNMGGVKASEGWQTLTPESKDFLTKQLPLWGVSVTFK